MNPIKVFGVVLYLLSIFTINGARTLGRHTTGDDRMISSRDGSHLDGGHMGLNFTEEEIMGIMDACNTTFPTPAEHLAVLNETGEFPDTASHDSKCYLNCLFSRTLLLDEMGNVHTSHMRKLFSDRHDDEIERSLQKCYMKRKEKNDACEESYESISCLIKEAINYYANKEKKNAEKDDKM